MKQVVSILKMILWFIALFGSLDFLLACMPDASPRLVASRSLLAWAPILGGLLLADALGLFRRIFR